MDDSSTYTVISPDETKDGTKLHGYIWPCKAPRAVMSLVHGFGEHSGRYAHMAKALNAKGIAVVTLDLRGHGRSDGKRGVIKNYDDFRGDLKTLLDKTRQLYPNIPHILYGHSMGGGIVLDHGLNEAAKKAHDIKAIIASAPLIKLTQAPPAILTPLIKCLRFINPKGAMKQPIDATKISTLKPEQRLYLNDPLNHGQCGFGTAIGMVEAGENIINHVQDWTTPLLLLHGKGDQLTDFSASETFAMQAQNTEFHAFENSEHELHNDIHRQAVYTLMLDFIERNIS